MQDWQRETARRMYMEGLSTSDISLRLGIRVEPIKAAVYDLRRMNDRPQKGRSLQQMREDAARLQAEIPDDTRSLTGRFCGDPLPGRSALDKAREGA